MASDNLLKLATQEIARLKAQLPDGMKHCTIVAKECSIGHSWLTATNWVQHGCPTCELNATKAATAAEQDKRSDVIRLLNTAEDELRNCRIANDILKKEVPRLEQERETLRQQVAAVKAALTQFITAWEQLLLWAADDLKTIPVKQKPRFETAKKYMHEIAFALRRAGQNSKVAQVLSTKAGEGYRSPEDVKKLEDRIQDLIDLMVQDDSLQDLQRHGALTSEQMQNAWNAHRKAWEKATATSQHSTHGRCDGSGPDDPDCPCRGTDKEARCAAYLCGFCMVAQTRKRR